MRDNAILQPSCGVGARIFTFRKQRKAGTLKSSLTQESLVGELPSWCSVYEPVLLNLAFVGNRRELYYLIGSAQETAHGGYGFSSHYEKKWLLLATADRKPLFPKGSAAAKEKAQESGHQHLSVLQNVGKSIQRKDDWPWRRQCLVQQCEPTSKDTRNGGSSIPNQALQKLDHCISTEEHQKGSNLFLQPEPTQPKSWVYRCSQV